MTDSYHYSLRQAYQLLMGLGRQIKQEYPVDHYFLNPDDRNSGVLSLPIPMHVVTPTVKHLQSHGRKAHGFNHGMKAVYVGIDN